MVFSFHQWHSTGIFGAVQHFLVPNVTIDFLLGKSLTSLSLEYILPTSVKATACENRSSRFLLQVATQLFSRGCWVPKSNPKISNVLKNSEPPTNDDFRNLRLSEWISVNHDATSEYISKDFISPLGRNLRTWNLCGVKVTFSSLIISKWQKW